MREKITWLNFAILLAIVGFVLLIVNIVWIVFVNKSITPHIFPIDFELAANIGSYVGGIIGVFWSGAGVILIYATFQKQQEFNENQVFEQTFQNLINSYYTIVNNTRGNIDVYGNFFNEDSIGREFFSDFLKKLKNGLNDESFIRDLLKSDTIEESKNFKESNNIQNNIEIGLYVDKFALKLNLKQNSDDGLSKELTVKMYEYFYEKYQNNLGHYFRFIFNTFKFIIENKKSESERRKYINLIQVHMSNDELGVLFYNALCKYALNKDGVSKFKKLLENYNFFENIDKQSLLNKKDAKYYKINYKFNRM